MSARNGFTLLEVLVVISLLGLVGTMTVGGLRFGHAVWERTATVADRCLETRVAQKLLRRVIAESRIVRVHDGSREPASYFDGTAERLRFIGRLPAHLAPPEDQLIELSVERGDDRDRRALVLRWSALGEDTPEIASTAPAEVLADDVEDFAFRYFGPREAGGRAWQSAWQLRRTRPLAVALEATGSGAEEWPPLVVRLKAEAPR